MFKQKKAAMEMSVGTIVTIVLLMSVLVLGLVLVQNIFTGAKYNVDQMNDKVRGEINKLFSEDQKLVVYLPDSIAKIEQGEPWGVAFAVNNDQDTQTFEYEVVLDDDNVQDKCGTTQRDAENWITTGDGGNFPLQSGDKHYETIRFNIPEGAVSDISSCLVRFRIHVYKEDESIFASQAFDVDVE